MRPIGLHFRLTTTLSDLFDRAAAVGSPIVQCFLIPQGASSHLVLTPEEIERCREKAQQFKGVYLHASYWVNLAGRYRNGWRPFHKELELAKALGFTHMVIHPGSATGCPEKNDGIYYLARALNKILSTEDSINLVLENAAHANKIVGGDITDFGSLLQLLDKPEKVSFCLDSAHAFSYGYDISTPTGVDTFVDLVDASIGAQRISLLHLNDAAEKIGSRIDKHAAPGQGLIGVESLRHFMNHPKLVHAPVLLELPVVSEQEEAFFLNQVRSWADL